MMSKPLFPKNRLFYNEQEMCNRPPDGWWCSRPPGHDGPCAARPVPSFPFPMPTVVWVYVVAFVLGIVFGFLTSL